MTDCLHINPVPHAVVYRLEDASGPGGARYTMHVSVFCPVCQARFKFQGNNALAPSRLEDALMDRRGAWVSASAEELGVIIAPDEEPGAALDQMEIAGRA